MNPVGEFCATDAEGATSRPAGGGETLRLKYHRGTYLWRVPAACGTPTGKALYNNDKGSNLSGYKDRGKADGLPLSFVILCCYQAKYLMKKGGRNTDG